MNLEDIFVKILEVCKQNYISVPYIVGGIPRDLYLGREAEFRDIDLTTNDNDIARLGITTAYELDYMFKVFPDSHVSVFLKDNTLDFSSHFVSSDAVSYIGSELNISDKKLFEVYSRDFTINTLHKELLDNNILDPIDMAFEDLDKKIIRTCVPAEITLKDDARRIFRAINFAARLGFEIDTNIIEYAKSNRLLFTGENRWVIKDSFLTSVIGEAISYDSDVVIHYLEEMDLLSLVPMVGSFKDELIKRKLVGRYLDDAINMTGYDLTRTIG